MPGVFADVLQSEWKAALDDAGLAAADVVLWPRRPASVRDVEVRFAAFTGARSAKATTSRIVNLARVRPRLVQGITKRKDSLMRPTIVLVHGAFADSSNWDVGT